MGNESVQEQNPNLTAINCKNYPVCKLSWATNCNDCTLCPIKEVTK